MKGMQGKTVDFDVFSYERNSKGGRGSTPSDFDEQHSIGSKGSMREGNVTMMATPEDMVKN